MVLTDDDTQIEKIDTLASSDRDADPELAAARAHASERLRAALDGLPERERKIAVLLYVYGLTLREIGEILGVTESRVCQIHRQILRKLRTQLDPHHQLFLAATAA
jgi:RNA polymerase sigma factor for flagellar operon FliA